MRGAIEILVHKKIWRRFGRQFVCTLVCIWAQAMLPISQGLAEPHPSEETFHSHQVFFPVGSQSDKSLHLVFSPEHLPIAEEMQVYLEDDFAWLASVLGHSSSFKSQIQLVQAKKFYKQLQVPKWTNAIYLRSKVIIPIEDRRSLRQRVELRRAVKHELVHALIDHQTKGRCPGWFDEGLAQLLEGSEHPVLKRALKRWISENGAIPFASLQSGFTKLPRKMVPAAYAQSLYSTKIILGDSTPEMLQQLFTNIQGGKSFSEAFERTYYKTLREFEDTLGAKLGKLVSQENQDPVRAMWSWGSRERGFLPIAHHSE